MRFAVHTLDPGDTLFQTSKINVGQKINEGLLHMI